MLLQTTALTGQNILVLVFVLVLCQTSLWAIALHPPRLLQTLRGGSDGDGEKEDDVDKEED